MEYFFAVQLAVDKRLFWYGMYLFCI